MTVYLNMRSNYGVETVDEFSSEEFDKFPEKEKEKYKNRFSRYVSEIISEYHLAGMNVYRSQRCTKEWRER